MTSKRQYIKNKIKRDLTIISMINIRVTLFIRTRLCNFYHKILMLTMHECTCGTYICKDLLKLHTANPTHPQEEGYRSNRLWESSLITNNSIHATSFFRTHSGTPLDELLDSWNGFFIKPCAGNFRTKGDRFSVDEEMKQHLENTVDSIYPEWMKKIKV